MFKSGLIFFILFCSYCHAEELQWNRYVDDDFVILSIDENQGSTLLENLNPSKKIIFDRWGFLDRNLKKECRIFCVPDKKTLKEFFFLNDAHVEIRDDVYVIWTFYDLAKIQSCLEEIVAYELNSSFWFRRGASVLSESIDDLKYKIISFQKRIKQNELIYTTEEIFNFTEEKYYEISSGMQNLFDEQSLLLCLMLRKEFGEVKLHSLFKFNDKKTGIIKNIIKTEK